MKKILVICRYLLVLPVIGCIILTAGVVIMGIGRIFTTGIPNLLTGDFSIKASKQLSLGVIEIIDLFLVGAVAYITAVGLYKLFISTEEVRILFRIKIETLQDLENKIIGVIIPALAVAFLGQAAGGDQPEVLLYYGGGIALVIAALAFFMKVNKKGDKDEKKEVEKEKDS